jgi:ABC-2 type transport system permease protein
MTTITLPRPEVGSPGERSSRHRVRDVVALTWRNLLHIAREPLQLSDVTIQPVLFTLLFVYVFGSGVVLSQGTYTDFAIAGLLAMNLTTSAMGTAVGLSSDLQTGIIDRFRTLPMWGPAVLVGRSVADLATATLCSAIVGLTGYAVGWRTHNGFLHLIAGFALFLLFSYALSWLCACIGLMSKGGPESAQGVGLIILFPLAIVSNALVPTTHMPTVLRFIANWNPVSAITAACRDLWGNPNPSAMIDAWPMQHPMAASLGWCAVLLLVFAPLATMLYRRRTSD